MAQKLPQLPDVERVSPSVVRIMGGNGGKGTNTYLIGTNPESLILLDTAQGFPAWRDNISSHLSETKAKITTCLLTHWHGDHTRGVPDLLSVSPDTKLYKNQSKSLDPDGALSEFHIGEISDGQKFDDGQGFEIEAVHCPGHTKDHMAFIITASRHEDEIGRMFTGDNVLGHGTAVFEDLAVYLKSLEVMRKRVDRAVETARIKGPVWAYPAHGAVIHDATAKFDEYISHRQMRENEALNVLKNGTTKASSDAGAAAGGDDHPGKEWTSMEMVKVIYKAYPENLHIPAEMGLLQVLNKLKGEGKVVQTSGGKWSLSERSSL